MIGNQLALIRREIWEHRAIYVTPIAIAVIVSLVSLAGMVTVSAFDKELNVALFSASNIAGDTERQAALTVFFLGTSWVFLFALAILTTFYTLAWLSDGLHLHHHYHDSHPYYRRTYHTHHYVRHHYRHSSHDGYVNRSHRPRYGRSERTRSLIG